VENMDITCIEVEGATYQPEDIFPLDNFWIIPATKNASAWEEKQRKVIIASQYECKHIGDILVEANIFIFCYQFLFLQSGVYCCTSFHPVCPYFIESGTDINAIADNISKKYETDGSPKISFAKIDTFYTQLSHKINFATFYNRFIEKYNNDDNFRNIIDLFLYTVGSRHKYYNNVFQKISQLQTIFETMLGTPDEEKQSCGKRHFKEEWKSFLTRKLKEKGIEDENDIDLIIKIKNILNWSARVKYTHYSKQLNTWQKTLDEIRYGAHSNEGSEYTTKFDDILNNTLKVKDWAGIDWDNVCFLYQVIIKHLIYLEYFN
jgi:hypothetical protein